VNAVASLATAVGVSVAWVVWFHATSTCCTDGHTAAERKALRRAAAAARAGSADLTRAAAAAERRLEQLVARRKALEIKLADPAIYSGPTAELMQLQLKFGEVKKAIAEAEENWLATQAALE